MRCVREKKGSSTTNRLVSKKIPIAIDQQTEHDVQAGSENNTITPIYLLKHPQKRTPVNIRSSAALNSVVHPHHDLSSLHCAQDNVVYLMPY